MTKKAQARKGRGRSLLAETFDRRAKAGLPNPPFRPGGAEVGNDRGKVEPPGSTGPGHHHLVVAGHLRREAMEELTRGELPEVLMAVAVGLPRIGRSALLGIAWHGEELRHEFVAMRHAGGACDAAWTGIDWAEFATAERTEGAREACERFAAILAKLRLRQVAQPGEWAWRKALWMMTLWRSWPRVDDPWGGALPRKEWA